MGVVDKQRRNKTWFKPKKKSVARQIKLAILTR